MSRLIDKQMSRATRSGALDNVQVLLESGASINHLHKDGFTPLMRPAYKGDTKHVQFLLTRGADLNQTAKDGASALFWASIRGHEPIVELLIAARARADVNAARRTDENNRSAGYPPIIAAIRNGHFGNATNCKTITPANAGRASRDVSDITGPVRRSALVTLL